MRRLMEVWRMFKERFSDDGRLKIVKNRRNVGFAPACNRGAMYARGKYFVFLNNDTEVDRNWIRELVEAMESNSMIVLAQSKLRLMSDRRRIQTVGNVHDYYCIYQEMVGFGEIDRGQYDKLDMISFASGAAMTVRRSAIDELGLFDPRYPFYHEDIDLEWRVLLAGYKIVSVPQSIVYHEGEGSINKFGKYLWAYWEAKSRLSLLIKNYSLRNVVKTVPFLLLVLTGGAFAFAAKRMILITGATIAGILWNVTNFKYIWKGRLVVQHLIRKVPDEDVIKRFVKSKLSAILLHYVRNPVRALR